MVLMTERSRSVRALLGACALVLSACGSPTPSGVGVCGLTGAPPPDCAPAVISLSTDACRCGSHFYWDGAACVSTAACTCYSGCEELYETAAECEADHASCLGADGGT